MRSAGRTARYVVLHHTGVEEPHFDFMLELEPGEPLRTWRVPCWPVGRFRKEATALDPHRNAFLDYEGRVSKGRGEVRRVAGGNCLVMSDVVARNRVSYHVNLDSGEQLSFIKDWRGKGVKARRKWIACSLPPAGA